MESSSEDDLIHYRREQLVLSPEIKESLKTLEGICEENRGKFKAKIFSKTNGRRVILDPFRKQISFLALENSLKHEKDKVAFRTIIANATDVLRKRAQEEDKHLSEGNILYSMPGGAKQSWHHDFPELDYTSPPRVYLIPISATARLDICTRLLEHPNKNTIISNYCCKRGDVFSFHGFLPHRGCAYSKNNFRIHFYSLHRGDLHLLPEIERHTEIFTEVAENVDRKKGRPRKNESK